MDIHNSIADIHNSIMDDHNTIMDIHNSIMDIHNYRNCEILAFHRHGTYACFFFMCVTIKRCAGPGVMVVTRNSRNCFSFIAFILLLLLIRLTHYRVEGVYNGVSVALTARVGHGQLESSGIKLCYYSIKDIHHVNGMYFPFMFTFVCCHCMLLTLLLFHE